MSTPVEKGIMGTTEIAPRRMIMVRVKPLESFKPYAYKGMPVAKMLPIILGNDHNMPIPSDQIEQNHFMLFRISETHRRSTVASRPNLNPQVFCLIDDERPFSANNLKGNEYQGVEITAQDNEEFGLRFERLAYVSDRHAVRLGVVTQYFKDKKRDTERLLHLYEYEELPWGDEVIPIEEYKKRLLEKFGNDFPQLSEALPKIHFVCWERTMAVPIRFENLAFSETQEEFNEKFQYIINIINQKEKLLYGNQAENFTMEDVYRYIVEYGARKAGKEFGENHKDGIVVTYCSNGNITGGWEFVDLEDVFGLALGLGDRKMTDEDFVDDISEFLNGKVNPEVGITYALRFMQNKGFLPANIPFEDTLVGTFLENFFISYFNARWDGDLAGNIGEIMSFINTLDISLKEILIQIVFSQLSVDDLVLGSFDNMVEQFFVSYEENLQTADTQTQKKSLNTVLKNCYHFMENSIEQQITIQLKKSSRLQPYNSTQQVNFIKFLADYFASKIIDGGLDTKANDLIEKIKVLKKKYRTQ